VWSADDTELFLEMPVSGAGHRNLYRVPVDGGEPRPLLSGASGNTDLTVAGDRFIYTHSVQQSEMVVFHPRTRSERVIKRSFRGIGNPRFDSVGERITAFVVAPFELAVFDTKDGDEMMVTPKYRSGFMPQWSDDDAWLYYYRLTPDTAFARFDLATGVETTLVANWQWDHQNGADADTSDQRIIYSVLDRGLPTATLIRDIETGAESVFHTTLKWPQWSSDESQVLGTRFAGQPGSGAAGNGDVTICQVEEPRCRTVAEGRIPRWSHDNSKVFFTRVTEDGLEVWASSALDTGNPERVRGNLEVAPYNEFIDVGTEDRVVWVRGNPFSSLWMTRIP